MNTITLTVREFIIYTGIQRFIAKFGFAPNMREIAALGGLAVGGDTDKAVRALADKGVIRRPPCNEQRCRALTLVRGIRIGVEP